LLLAVRLAGQTGSNVPPTATASTEALAQALHLYRTGQFAAAETQYQELLRRNDDSGEAHAGLARTYLRQQKVDQAADVLRQAVTRAPDSAGVRTALGELHFRQGKIDEAGAEFQKAVRALPDMARAHWGVGLVAKTRSLHAQAKREFDTARQLDPDDPDIQRDWLRTLNMREQARVLEHYLAGATNDDEEERGALQRRLGLLEALLERPPMPCSLVNEIPTVEADLRPLLDGPQHLRGYGLEVNVNGRSSMLLLDTGASQLLISRRLAEKAGVERLAESRIKGVGDEGGSGGYYGYAASIKVGQLEFRDCVVRVSEKTSAALGDGLIGADLFAAYLVKLDFPKRKLRLSELPKHPGEQPRTAAAGEDDPPLDAYLAPEMKSYTPVYGFGHMLLIPTRVGNAAPRLLQIDTGAQDNTLSTEAARDVPGMRANERSIQGLGGKVQKSATSEEAVLQFGGARHENQHVTAFDLSHVSKLVGTELSGMLGLRMLRSMVVSIDYRDGLVEFRPGGK
jgi:tetratricopeptide (TPR) repeat protein